MESAIQNLVNMRDVDSLYEVMTESDDWMLCLDAAEGLIKLGDERGVQFLLDATESDEEDIHDVAREILASPEVKNLRDEIRSRQSQGRKEAVETARKRIQQGKKVFRYKTVYLPASYFTGNDSDEDGESVPVLDEFGLEGWQVAAFLSHRDSTPAVSFSGKLTGGYFLLQKEIGPDELSELEEQ